MTIIWIIILRPRLDWRFFPILGRRIFLSKAKSQEICLFCRRPSELAVRSDWRDRRMECSRVGTSRSRTYFNVTCERRGLHHGDRGQRDLLFKMPRYQRNFSPRPSTFSVGNFERFLSDTQERFDLIVASGVLYHLMDPLLALLDLMRLTDRIFVWNIFSMMPLCRSHDMREVILREKLSSGNTKAHILLITSAVMGACRILALSVVEFMGNSVWLDVRSLRSLNKTATI